MVHFLTFREILVFQPVCPLVHEEYSAFLSLRPVNYLSTWLLSLELRKTLMKQIDHIPNSSRQGSSRQSRNSQNSQWESGKRASSTHCFWEKTTINDLPTHHKPQYYCHFSKPTQMETHLQITYVVYNHLLDPYRASPTFFTGLKIFSI